MATDVVATAASATVDGGGCETSMTEGAASFFT